VLTENLRRDLAAFVAEVEAWADELDSYEALDPEGRVEIVRDYVACWRALCRNLAAERETAEREGMARDD
jgi:hypothetical protein